MSEPSYKHILARLMADRGLKEQDVADATGLPRTTIVSILKGRSNNPRPLTLKILADLFGVTIEQLLGYENLTSALTLSKRSSPLTIPLLQWPEVKLWLEGKQNSKNYKSWLLNGICKSPQAFALKIKASMKPHFASSTAMLLIDPQISVEDNLIVLVFLEDSSQEPTLRRVTVEDEKQWLQPLEKGIPPVVLSSKHLVVGPVVQVRYDPRVG
jgi:SOS-response transcriptional repressor LexA